MKSKIIKGSLLLSSVIFLSGCSLNIQVGDSNKLDPNEFLGEWSSVRPYIEFTKKGENEYKADIHWESSVSEYSRWEYTCTFNEDNEKMECTGDKYDGESGEIEDYFKEDKVSSNIKATFELKDGNLIWIDEESHDADDITFTKDNN